MMGKVYRIEEEWGMLQPRGVNARRTLIGESNTLKDKK